ncbi:AAA family ATPase [Vibrio parahaemolyticus]|uniref:AAA family ATPase n=1 Tax=Vibrio TaxID=662 RepID=UPI001A23101A|nr:AAA family ATPase [Vibrio sp. YT-18]EGQ7920092.1 AAA family ATPase [Vibrio parahaemolyticus]EJS0325236.1 AAA family ATPase [Vibrio alginolyticus]EGQ9944397.1 AAA family ATPase [Vibrio parahaemolyticus]EGR0771078.1 AAA family ATPase [Vibrio parahaemolyticus]EGR0840728.1 AAA family ATPase [Vibrio parahaemolyticus]
MKRILITGVFGTGKTSLIEQLSNKLNSLGKRVKVVSEVARICPFNLNKEQTMISTSWLVMAQIENEILFSKENHDYDYVIFDRGIPDIIAHTKILTKSSNDDELYIRKLEELGKASLFSFDYIFLSKRSDNFKIQVDGMRVDDEAYQKSLEEIHIGYLENGNASYIALVENNNDRVEQISRVIL